MGAGMGSDEEMIEFAVRFLLFGGHEARELVYELVVRWPDVPPLQTIYALSMAAGGAEQMIAGPEISRVAQDVWRMTGLLGVDLFLLEQRGTPCLTAADLLAFWRTEDDVFFLPRGA